MILQRRWNGPDVHRTGGQLSAVQKKNANRFIRKTACFTATVSGTMYRCMETCMETMYRKHVIGILHTNYNCFTAITTIRNTKGMKNTLKKTARGIVVVTRSMTWLEMIPVVAAVLTWGQQWRGQRVRLYCDNMGVIAIWHRGVHAICLPPVCFLRQ